MKTKLNLFLIIMLTLNLWNCSEGPSAGDKTALNSYAMTALQSSSTARNKCVTAVGIMNQCIGAGYQTQFNPDNMCSDANLKTEAEYDTLISCTSQKVNTTYCNFPQNRVADARRAKTNFFSSCDEPVGILVTDWYTITIPTL
jgi:hypothetical protein